MLTIFELCRQCSNAKTLTLISDYTYIHTTDRKHLITYMYFNGNHICLSVYNIFLILLKHYSVYRVMYHFSNGKKFIAQYNNIQLRYTIT